MDRYKQAIQGALTILGTGSYQHDNCQACEAIEIEVDAAKDTLRWALGLYPEIPEKDLKLKLKKQKSGYTRAEITHLPSGYSTWVEAKEEVDIERFAKGLIQEQLGGWIIERAVNEAPGSFVSSVIAGTDSVEDLKSWIDHYNRGCSDKSLADYLGFNQEEMKEWQLDPSLETTQKLIDSRRQEFLKTTKFPYES